MGIFFLHPTLRMPPGGDKIEKVWVKAEKRNMPLSLLVLMFPVTGLSLSYFMG